MKAYGATFGKPPPTKRAPFDRSKSSRLFRVRQVALVLGQLFIQGAGDDHGGGEKHDGRIAHRIALGGGLDALGKVLVEAFEFAVEFFEVREPPIGLPAFELLEVLFDQVGADGAVRSGKRRVRTP